MAHFKGLAVALVPCGVHPLIQHVQGYPGSRWMPSLGDYSLPVALAAAGATANKTMMKKGTNFAGHFDGHGGAPV